MNVKLFLTVPAVVAMAAFVGCSSDSSSEADGSSAGAASGGSAGKGGAAGHGGKGGSGGHDAGLGDAGGGPDGGVGGSGGSLDGGLGGTGGGGVPDGGGAGGLAGSGGSSVDSGLTYGPAGPSCTGMKGNECQGESCCANILLPGGTFPMGRSTNGTDAYDTADYGAHIELPEHDATVADFYLDRYEVTVGRFRRFVEQYNGTLPVEGFGAHPLILGSGWQDIWQSYMPKSQAELIENLKCGQGNNQTWTDAPGAHEDYAIGCLSWFEAFAFCAWDGGRLPTEAEWEYAAAGGDENRLYPWGSTSPKQDGLTNCYHVSTFLAVGTYALGAGRWGHLDLAGGAWEWTLDWLDYDWYKGKGQTCDNCANLSDDSGRTNRGGCWDNLVGSPLRAAFRSGAKPTSRGNISGVRCARNP